MEAMTQKERNEMYGIGGLRRQAAPYSTKNTMLTKLIVAAGLAGLILGAWEYHKNGNPDAFGIAQIAGHHIGGN